MTETEVRLEALKLAHAQGRTPEEVLVRAKTYANYVCGEQKSKSEAVKPEFESSKEKRIQAKAN